MNPSMNPLQPQIPREPLSIQETSLQVPDQIDTKHAGQRSLNDTPKPPSSLTVAKVTMAADSSSPISVVSAGVQKSADTSLVQSAGVSPSSSLVQSASVAPQGGSAVKQATSWKDTLLDGLKAAGWKIGMALLLLAVAAGVIAGLAASWPITLGVVFGLFTATMMCKMMAASYMTDALNVKKMGLEQAKDTWQYQVSQAFEILSVVTSLGLRYSTVQEDRAERQEYLARRNFTETPKLEESAKPPVAHQARSKQLDTTGYAPSFSKLPANDPQKAIIEKQGKDFQARFNALSGQSFDAKLVQDFENAVSDFNLHIAFRCTDPVKNQNATPNELGRDYDDCVKEMDKALTALEQNAPQIQVSQPQPQPQAAPAPPPPPAQSQASPASAPLQMDFSKLPADSSIRQNWEKAQSDVKGLKNTPDKTLLDDFNQKASLFSAHVAELHANQQSGGVKRAELLADMMSAANALVAADDKMEAAKKQNLPEPPKFPEPPKTGPQARMGNVLSELKGKFSTKAPSASPNAAASAAPAATASPPPASPAKTASSVPATPPASPAATAAPATPVSTTSEEISFDQPLPSLKGFTPDMEISRIWKGAGERIKALKNPSQSTKAPAVKDALNAFYTYSNNLKGNYPELRENLEKALKELETDVPRK